MRGPDKFSGGAAACLSMVLVFASAAASAGPGTTAAAPYLWRNVTITGGGLVDGLLFNPAKKGLIYARTNVGGAYRWDAATRRWSPLNDWAGGKDANLLGCESIGVDPTDPDRVYMAAGMYTQSWAGNGAILRSTDQGRTWRLTDVPFKMGANEQGRWRWIHSIPATSFTAPTPPSGARTMRRLRMKASPPTGQSAPRAWKRRRCSV